MARAKITDPKVCKTCGEAKPLAGFWYTKPTQNRPYGRYSSYCRPCSNQYRYDWNAKNPERLKARTRRYYVKNREKHLARSRAQASTLKLAVFAAYGTGCACCGEQDQRFLTIDHIERPKKKSSYEKKALYAWLKKHGYPAGFQTLCWNCNMAKGIYGTCPHRSAEKIAPAIAEAMKRK